MNRKSRKICEFLSQNFPKFTIFHYKIIHKTAASIYKYFGEVEIDKKSKHNQNFDDLLSIFTTEFDQLKLRSK